MKNRNALGSGLVMLGLLLGTTGCTEESTTTGGLTLEPEHAAGTTDSAGSITLDLAQYDIQVHITANGQPTSGVHVELFQGDALGLIWAELEGYYSNFQLMDLSSIDGDQTVNLSLTPQAIEYYEWTTDPNLFSLLYEDPGFSEHCAQGNLESVYQQAQTWGSPFLFLRAYGNGASLRDGNVSVGLDFGSMSYDAFEQVAFGLFGFISEDVFEFCYYTLELEGTTFVLPTIHIGTIVTQGTAYDYKFILTWGENPRDLDSHLFTPEIEGTTHHVYYANSGTPTSAPYAWLDVDDTSSYGPEVVTIQELYPGMYTYAIYEYSGNNTLTESEAVVQVFNGRTLIGTYTIPTTPQAGDNWWWTVGTVNGTTGAFTLVNTVAADAPEGAPARPTLPAKID